MQATFDFVNFKFSSLTKHSVDNVLEVADSNCNGILPTFMYVVLSVQKTFRWNTSSWQDRRYAF